MHCIIPATWVTHDEVILTNKLQKTAPCPPYARPNPTVDYIILVQVAHSLGNINCYFEQCRKLKNTILLV